MSISDHPVSSISKWGYARTARSRGFSMVKKCVLSARQNGTQIISQSRETGQKR